MELGTQRGNLLRPSLLEAGATWWMEVSGRPLKGETILYALAKPGEFVCDHIQPAWNVLGFQSNPCNPCPGAPGKDPLLKGTQ